MNKTRRLTAGGSQSDGALACAHYSTLRAEIFPTICAGAREVGIAVSVALFCAVPVLVIIVGRLWSLSEF